MMHDIYLQEATHREVNITDLLYGQRLIHRMELANVNLGERKIGVTVQAAPLISSE